MKGDKTQSEAMSARPVGVTVLAAIYVLLCLSGLYIAVDQYRDPFLFEGQEYTMWSMRAGPFFVAYLLSVICAAVVLYLGMPSGRIGIVALITPVAAYFVYGVFETLAWREHPDSRVAWWYGVGVALVTTLWVASNIWYLFSARRNNWFRRFNIHA